MVSQTPTDGRCNYEYTPEDEYDPDSGFCESHPMDNGRCYHHGGQRLNGGAPEGNTNGEGDGAPEGNANAATHELYSASNTYYQRRDETAQQLIDAIFTDYHEAYVARHGDPPTGDEAMLFKVAVNIHKQLKADDWGAEKPDSLDAGHPLIDRSEQRTPQGESYYEYVVTAVDKAEHRLATRTRQWLKDMDLLGGDEGTTVNVNVHEELLSGLKAAHQD